MGKFEKLGLKKEIITALDNLNLKVSFEVQDKVIPLALQKKNIVFTSQTGSGKTLAYALGYLGSINTKQGLQMLVLVPTRELCIQVGKEIKKIGDLLDINTGMLYGGRDIPGDFRTLSKKNQIMVATPGRLIMHVNERKLKIGEVKYLVFDESDQMFDQGFYDNCVYIKSRVSSDAQLILASATMTRKVKEFIEIEIINYDLLRIGILIPKNITQEKVYCDKLNKNEIILTLLKYKDFKRAMIFCNTKLKSNNIAKYLLDNHFNAKALNGDLEQKQRLNHLNLFKEGKINILVATDVGARGLQIEQVDIVVNYDVPTKSEFYIHRIGRTGRTEKAGYSLTLICPEDEERFENIESEFRLKIKNKSPI